MFLEVSTEFATNRVLFLGESVFYLFLNIADVKICETVKKKVRGFSFIIYIYIYIYKMIYPQYFQNIFTINSKWQIILVIIIETKK